MSELLALADRCEADTVPDRDLDDDIVSLMNPDAIVGPGCAIPHFTASLDAALSLYLILPNLVPSCPRKATADALRQRAGEER